MLLQVHDELLFETPRSSLDALVATATQAMTVDAAQWLQCVSPFFSAQESLPAWASEAATLLGGSGALQVPLGVTVEVGQNWGSMTPY